MMKIEKKDMARLNFFRLGLIALTLALLLLSLPMMAHAAEPAATVDAVAGQATAVGDNGAIRPLAKGDSVFSGDIISTGPNSRLRLVFSDEGVIFLRPSTRFVIDSYKHTGNAQQDESRFSLVKGGFRSVTGAIGQANHDKVKIETPVATIGIRGTDHEGRFCAGDCLDLTNIGVSAPADGLYTATNAGQTVVGNQNFGPGQYGYTNPAGVTVHLPGPPPILLADPSLRGAMPPKKGKGKKGKASSAAGNHGNNNGQGRQGQAGQSGQSGQGEQSGAEGEEGFDIPAQPPATHAVQCQ